MHTVVAFVVAIGILVLCHEFGHFIVAKYFKIRVDGFGVGMGPKLIAWRRGDTEYRINALPIGGYCKMAGEEENFEDPAGFFAKPVTHRFLVVFAGPFFNMLLALLIFCLAGVTVGVPTETSHSVVWDVLKGSPAEKAGFKTQDVILSINGKEVKKYKDVQSKISGSPNKTLTVEVLRNKQKMALQVTPQIHQDRGKKLGRIGIMFAPYELKRTGIVESITTGIKQTYEWTMLIVQSLVSMLSKLFVGQTPKDIGGPIAIAQMAGQSAQRGIGNFIMFLAMVSLNLGIINLFPFPALDGGRLIFLTAEILRGKKLDPKKENVFHLVGFAVLMLLMVVLVYTDIMRLLPKK